MSKEDHRFQSDNYKTKVPEDAFRDKKKEDAHLLKKHKKDPAPDLS